jgi:indolepyruvate ferredoxin oxidoreductase, beta subunit
MQTNIIIAGVGGQGILTIASIIDLAAMQQGLQVKQAEVHGMSQRGGAVESHLRISDTVIYSDLIPKGKANLILSIEPMEALRYLPFLAPDGMIVTATEPLKNINNYPAEDAIRAEISKSGKHLLVNAEALAREAGNLKAFNTVMLGASASYIGIGNDALENAIETYFTSKGEAVVELNRKAFLLGLAAI